MKSLVVLSGIILTIFLPVGCSKQTGNESQSRVIPDSVYIRQGDLIVTKTFDTLRNALTSAIADGGFLHAISFCNEAAYPITSVYQREGITIRRASDRYRNPENMADSLESAALALFVSDKSPRIIRTNEGVHYVKPIVVQGMCLYCHGVPGKEIKPEVLAAIREKYPEDRATGYQEGDLRGLWHVVFTKMPE